MISLHAVSHTLADKCLFNKLSLTLQNRRYGLVGPNGIGKSTLARIIAGKESPTAGEVSTSCEIQYFAQIEPAPSITLGEYLCEVWELPQSSALLRSLLADLDLGRPLQELSGGEWTRARLARILTTRSDFLILDEPSNNLDREGRETIRTFLQRRSAGILLISHDRELLEHVDCVIELSNQGASLYEGNFDSYWRMRMAERSAHEEQLATMKQLAKKVEQENQKKLESQERRVSHGKKRVVNLGLSRLEAQAMKRSGQKSSGAVCKSNSTRLQQQVSRVRQSWDQMKIDPFLRLDFEGATLPEGKNVVALDQVNWNYDGAIRKLWPMPLEFRLQGPRRWQILGNNGSGKSTLAKLIVNRALLAPGTLYGSIHVGVQSIAYLDQSYGLLRPEESILDNLLAESRYSLTELRNELAFYGFTASTVFQKVSTLSGGELLRASLAHMFLGSCLPELIVLDEPTNNLDLQSIALLEQAIIAFRGALIVISHDQEFARRIGIEDSLRLDSASTD